MSVVRWANENYHAPSVYRRTVATGIVTFAEWSLSALVALVPVVVIAMAFEWTGTEIGVQMLTVVWIALTALVLGRVWGWARDPELVG